MFRIYYCRDCGNYTYFKFYSEHVYLATLKGIVYGDIVTVKTDIKRVVCQVCGSENVDHIDVKFASDIPDLKAFKALKSEDRVKAFDNLKKELEERYGGD